MSHGQQRSAPTTLAAASGQGGCSISLVRTTSKKPCVLDQSFGCEGSTMWIGSGCRGHFLCGNNLLTCGFSGLQYMGPRHVCTCAPFYTGGTFLAGTGKPVLALPSDLIAPSAPLHPRLVEASQGKPRFVAGSVNESLTATFAFWNLLDAQMHQIAPEQNYQTGYVRELQLRRMVNLARDPKVRTYCEIGMNGGHSAAAMLFANPRLVVHTFDLMGWKYSEPNAATLKTMFGPRLQLHPGDSTKTVPEWTRANPGTCDLVFVDGDHSQQGAHKDFVNMRYAAAPGALGVADDIVRAPSWVHSLSVVLSHSRTLALSHSRILSPTLSLSLSRTLRRTPHRASPWKRSQSPARSI